MSPMTRPTVHSYNVSSGLYMYTDASLAAVTARYANLSDAELRTAYVERTECTAGRGVRRDGILRKLADFEPAAWVIARHLDGSPQVHSITASEIRDYAELYATEEDAYAVAYPLVDATPAEVTSDAGHTAQWALISGVLAGATLVGAFALGATAIPNHSVVEDRVTCRAAALHGAMRVTADPSYRPAGIDPACARLPQADRDAIGRSVIAEMITRTFGVKTASDLPPCAEEDSPGPCYWDAQTRGNGLGTSFVRA